MEMLRLFTDEFKKLNGEIEDYTYNSSFKETSSFTKYCIDLEVYDEPLVALFG